MSERRKTHVPDRAIGRREFTAVSAMAILSGVVVTVTGCSKRGGGGGSSPTSPTSPPGAGRAGAVSLNHGHVASVTSAQIATGGDIIIDITGTATHPHTVMLTGAELTQIGAGQRVSKESTNNDAHTHTVTFN